MKWTKKIKPVLLIVTFFLVALSGSKECYGGSVERQHPKYIFLFIGDGMSYPQIQLTSDYLGAMKQTEGIDTVPLRFMDFPIIGAAQTYDASSYCPDSASTVTAIASGHRTLSGTINMDVTKTIPYETIAEKLKKKLNYQIGIITSVNVNHGTPAGFYAHQPSRNNYYKIGKEMIASGFDYFAGGEPRQLKGEKKNQLCLYELARQAGYRVITSQREAKNLSLKDGKAIVIGETLADQRALPFEIDRVKSEWTLKDYVANGIQSMDLQKGFFMMVEGGKIDWACHANDAATVIHEVEGFNDAVQTAVEFYKKHPKETLILVTGDHETGGLSIGYAKTEYQTDLPQLSRQKLSFAKYDEAYIRSYRQQKPPFDQVLEEIQECFGIDPATLTKQEKSELEEAYALTVRKVSDKQQTDSETKKRLYGTNEPLTIAILHVLSHRAGINFSTFCHSGLPVPVFAMGQGSECFEGYYENIEIYERLAALMQVDS